MTASSDGASAAGARARSTAKQAGKGNLSAWQKRLGLQRLFLVRLRRLARLRQAWSSCLSSPPSRLLELALFSTYQDCARLGLRDQAREILGLPDA